VAALDRALASSKPSDPVMISGSFHVLAALDATTSPA
jgi:hypothetical protein